MLHQLKGKAKIISTGIYLPNQVVSSISLLEEIHSEEQYGIEARWMDDVMGIEERRMADSGTLPSELAIPAAEQALETINEQQRNEIDLVIFCGIERDQPEPATAHTIQNKLGINARYAFDVANACFGFVEAMQIATMYIECGIVKYALITTGEVPSKVAREAVSVLKKGVDIETARNIIGALSVGDAGGAVIMGPSKKSGFEVFNTISLSKHVNNCMYRQKEDGSLDGQMIMGKLASAFIRCHNGLIKDTLDQLGWDSFDWLLSHQIGRKPFERLAKMKGVESSKMIKTIDKYGNVTTATFPLNFDKLIKQGEVEPGDRIGGCFAGSGIVIGQLGYTF